MNKEFYYEGLEAISALMEARNKIASIKHPEFLVKRNQLLIQLTGMINPIRVAQVGLEPEVYEVHDEDAIEKLTLNQ